MPLHSDHCYCKDCVFARDEKHNTQYDTRLNCETCGKDTDIFGEDYYNGLEKLASNAVKFNHYDCLLIIHIISLQRLRCDDMFFVNWSKLFKKAVKAHNPELARFVLYSIRKHDLTTEWLHTFPADRQPEVDKQKVFEIPTWMIGLLIDSDYPNVITDAIDTKHYSFSKETKAHSDGLYSSCAEKGHTKLIGYMLAHNVIPSEYDKTNSCTHAAIHGHLDCLHFLRSVGFGWDEDTTRVAYLDDSNVCLLYLLNNGCPYTPINGISRDDMIKQCSQ